MFIPKKFKFRKKQRGRNRGKSLRGNTLSFGEYGLQILESGFIKPKQIEAARRAISRHIKRGGEVYIRDICDTPITKIPQETRMGKGKGPVEDYILKAKPGRILFELSGVNESLAYDALILAGAKLPVKTKIVKQNILEML